MGAIGYVLIYNACEDGVSYVTNKRLEAGAQSHMWVYRSDIYEKQLVVIYDHHKTRSADNSVTFLEGFLGNSSAMGMQRTIYFCCQML